MAAWLLCVTGCGADVVAIVGTFEAGVGPHDAPADEASADPADAGDAAADCPAQLAADVLQSALCACGDLSLPLAGLTTDAFDSRLGAYGPGALVARAGGVGIAGAFTTADLLDSTVVIDGDMRVARLTSPGLAPALMVRGDLSVAGPFNYLAGVDVGGDLVLGGDLAGTGSLHVAGDLRQAAGAARDPAAMLRVDGADVRGDVLLPAPCPCEAARALDVGGLVARAKAHNDNAVTGFDPDGLANVFATAPVDVAGQLFVPSMEVSGSLTLVVHGKAALLVEGDANVAGALAIVFDPQGSLDLFIGGNLLWGGTQVVDEAARPTQLRVYVGGKQVVLGIPTGFVGYLHAPGSDILTTVPDVQGAILAHDLIVTLPLAVHRDVAIGAAGVDCLPADP